MGYIAHRSPDEICVSDQHNAPRLLMLKPNTLHVWQCPDCKETQTLDFDKGEVIKEVHINE